MSKNEQHRVNFGSLENTIIIVPSNRSQSGRDELACSAGHQNPGFTLRSRLHCDGSGHAIG